MVAHRKINEFQNVKTVESVLNIPRYNNVPFVKPRKRKTWQYKDIMFYALIT